MYEIGIIGCGLIGNKRAESLTRFNETVRLTAVSDINESRAKELATKHNCKYYTDWKEITQNEDINIVFVCTINKFLAEITIDALKHGKHVLVEKPAARTVKEIERVITEYKKHKRKQFIKVGFNHRFHPSIQKAKELIEDNTLSEIMFIRGRYGHGGRPGYNKEWRAQKKLSGGGELIDQGSHLIDLSRYFLGNITTAKGMTATYYWKQKVEDNAFLLLKTHKGKIAQLSASSTQWKNLFSFEIFFQHALIVIDGLGKSYGQEKLTLYRMKPEMGPPDPTEYVWPDLDESWDKELSEFIDAINSKREPNGNIHDAYENLKIIEKIYRRDSTG